MSLVAYDSSDDNSEDETSESVNGPNNEIIETSVAQPSTKLCLPTPKHCEKLSKLEDDENDSDEIDERNTLDKIHFENLPKPKTVGSDDIVEEEDDLLTKKETQQLRIEKPIKKDRAPVKITVPSLSEFKDLDEETERKNQRVMPSKKGTGLFAILPPPKMSEEKKSNLLIPQVVTKKITNVSETKSKILAPQKAVKATTVKKALLTTNYDSNSEDEDDTSLSGNNQPTSDFFSLSTTSNIPDIPMSEVPFPGQSESALHSSGSAAKDLEKIDVTKKYSLETSRIEEKVYGDTSDDKTLVSNVMNLSKEEILLKNKAEVGPKLPVPEQEYHIDTEGNVAFDEKAIEYLCGRRGVKRKPKEIEEGNIIEINGEDIKPDERDWLVKALTEEPVQRPVSMMGGVNSQSKKKHQITYLAHQAKAMEMELKNQWALNRMTRKQTQSKYGF